MTQEYMPKGFSNWTEFYLSKKRRTVIEQFKIGVLIAALFAAYCFIGNLELL